MKFSISVAAVAMLFLVSACNNQATEKAQKDTTVIPEYNGDTKVPVDTAARRDSLLRVKDSIKNLHKN